MSYVLIIGAKSEIAQATAREYARHGYDIYLAARNVDELENLVQDIKVRSAVNVILLELDILNIETHQHFYDNLEEKPLGVISVVGYLGEQKRGEVHFEETQKIINTNFIGIVSLFNIIANDFEARRSGFMVGISSVAGDRGRKSNYIYGAAKAAFTTYLSGLRNRLYESQVHVMTVKPGFVNTKMTKGMNLPEKLTAEPEEIAIDIFKAQQKNKDILYTIWIWRWIMLAIHYIPEFQFKKMSI
ncbi:MAG TPA: SDR family oxidoreductase [Arcobacter sp.]|nr:SDR family oxidoreductase [Arcobacter sp.]